MLAAVAWLGWGAMPDMSDAELDCARPAEARALLGRLMLAEIEGAEDIQREALWSAWGSCPAGAAGDSCRDALRQQFEARWDREKARIQGRYRERLDEFVAHCRGQLG